MSHIAELHDRASCKTPFSGNQNGIGWSTNTNRSANPVLFCKFLEFQPLPPSRATPRYLSFRKFIRAKLD